MSVSLPGSSDALRDLGEAKRFYDERYQGGYMDDDDWSAEKRARVANVVRELDLSSTGRVLDYGCGTGVFTAVLKEVLPGWQVCGTDVSTAAMERARSRLPGCEFRPLDQLAGLSGKFDLIFSHHVLEHVSDLPSTARLLGDLLATSGTMLHILPCGNPGSLAHTVCMSVANGIEHESEDRFFFEEEGHLRRLTTDRLVGLWSERGLRLRRAYYAEQFYGALSSATQFDLQFARSFAAVERAANARSARRLRRLRAGLTGLWLLRKPAALVRYKLRFGCRGLRDLVLLVLGLPLYPISALSDWAVKRLATWEWTHHQQNPGGAEMYVVLARP